NRHGGSESTILALNNVFYHWGAVIVSPGFTDQRLFASGGNPYERRRLVVDIRRAPRLRRPDVADASNHNSKPQRGSRARSKASGGGRPVRAPGC
ncbi:MAG: hypothetical protein QOC68_4729, partial [Solirubrobacteraceae bacterium]|nr:hypothetical protein [Solirubrobacteraceae bacterium]